MNKRNTRAFAFGVLISVCTIGAFYFSMDREKSADLNIKNAQSLLEDNGYVVLAKDTYDQMNKTITNQTKQAEPKEQEKIPKPPETEEISLTYQLEIVSGMFSHDIAVVLAEKNIIDDANQFETYLEENGYSKRIQLGTFELNAKMSYKEIAKIITKS